MIPAGDARKIAADLLTRARRRELERMAEEAERERQRLGWPSLLRALHHEGFNAAVLVLAVEGQRPCASTYPLEEAVALRTALGGVIEAMRAKAAAGKKT
jgi:hypothetical protein